MATLVTTVHGNEQSFYDTSWKLDIYGHLVIENPDDGEVALFAAGTWASAVHVEDE